VCFCQKIENMSAKSTNVINVQWPVIIYPEVAAASLKSKLHNAYAVFIIVKAYDEKNNGSGLIPLKKILQIAQSVLGISRSQAYRVLASGIDVFWRSPNKKVVGLFSHLRAYYNLGISMFASKPVRLTIGQMGYGSKFYNGNAIKDLMVCSVASWDNGGSPIAIDTISELTSVSSRTIQRQLRVMSNNHGIVLEIMAGYRLKCDNLNQVQAKSQVQELNSRGMVKYHSIPMNGKFAILERVGNTYTIKGVERLGRRRRHRHLKSITSRRKY
jgi:hypothetical protein